MIKRPDTAVPFKAQEGLWFNKLKKGCEIYADEGYHFYNTQIAENFDEDGNLVEEEKRSWLIYTTCLCETEEQVNQHIIGAKKPEGGITNGE